MIRLRLILLTAITLLHPVLRGADAAPAGAERLLFDGRSLAGWTPSAFDTQGPLKIEPSFRGDQAAIVAEKTEFLSGINWADATSLPRTNYEVSLDAMKLSGSDFFCGLTFPVDDSACTFVVGGWGGNVVGLSCVDNSDASDNDTTSGRDFPPDRWYHIRVRVTPGKIEAWIDDEKFVDLETTGRKIDLRFGDIKHSLPLGVAAYQTRAAWRDIRLRRL